MPTEEQISSLPYSVFKRYDNGTYALRFKLTGYPQMRIGLRTRDETAAHALAAEKYMEAKIKAEHKLLTGVASFDRLANEYVAQLFKEAERDPKRLVHAKHGKATVERYLIPFFGKKAITGLQYHHVLEYLDWRKVYWTEGPGIELDFIRYQRNGKGLRMPARHKEASKSTLRRESSFIRGVFKHAVRKGYLKQSDIPKIQVGKVEHQKRSAFTKEEYAQLIHFSEQRIMAAAGKRKVMFERAMLHNYIWIAAETGMRPTELGNLNWGHIIGFEEARTQSGNDRLITIIAQGKGRQPTKFVPKRSAITGFINIWAIFATQFGREPNESDPVFANYKGERIGSFATSLNALLKEAGLTRDYRGNKFSAYCFRHSYATWQLQKSPPIPIHTLAGNMRTSVEMIEKWYSDVISEDHASVLLGDDEW